MALPNCLLEAENAVLNACNSRLIEDEDRATPQRRVAECLSGALAASYVIARDARRDTLLPRFISDIRRENGNPRRVGLENSGSTSCESTGTKTIASTAWLMKFSTCANCAADESAFFTRS